MSPHHLQVDRAAAGLLALGLTKGDRLGMWGPNSYEWILMQFATAKVGIILVSCIVHLLLRLSERFILRSSDISA